MKLYQVLHRPERCSSSYCSSIYTIWHLLFTNLHHLAFTVSNHIVAPKCVIFTQKQKYHSPEDSTIIHFTASSQNILPSQKWAMHTSRGIYLSFLHSLFFLLQRVRGSCQKCLQFCFCSSGNITVWALKCPFQF